jgi:CspA family cold shock protein
MPTRGRVKWFDPKKGYGFIVGPDGQDVFVHYSHIEAEGFRLLKDGEWVDYELLQGEKGWQAREVHRLSVHVNPEAVQDPVRVQRDNAAASDLNE